MKYREALDLAHKNAAASSAQLNNIKKSSNNDSASQEKLDSKSKIDKGTVMQYLDRKKREKEEKQNSSQSGLISKSTSNISAITESKKIGKGKSKKEDDIFSKAVRLREEKTSNNKTATFVNTDHHHFMERVMSSENKLKGLNTHSSSSGSVKTFQELMQKAEMLKNNSNTNVNDKAQVTNGNSKLNGNSNKKSKLHKHDKDYDSKIPQPPEYSKSYLETRKKELSAELLKVNKMLEQWDQIEQFKHKNIKKQNHNSHLSTSLHVSSSKVPFKRKHSVSDEDDEDNDDLDSFIDDTGDAGAENYHEIIREVHKSLNFDPRKYKDVDPNDDCRNMVASFKDIEREEKRSYRAGASEDKADIRAEEERRARRMHKKHLKK